MVQFKAVIEQFAAQGEKTGWSYINVPAEIALQLKPDNKKSFRVKGKLDNYTIKGVALLPMGGGDFIMAINADMRKGIGKRKGASVMVKLEVDKVIMIVPDDLMECFNDEPGTFDQFQTLAKSHQGYFIKWINEAKTEQTRTKRIALTVSAMAKKYDYGTMIRESRKEV
ncbi:YdeI/OmpD-associated family protein [Danxiaibacter flavus]|uniref:YdeI/OmpD-associated family protein n=1 Tax=Danxiaibacter flavus TaxID=3049108 RepID=A0ABV3Z9P1_9BACT|nr:YdeI/OmpD-associated family protein [Chitinophagaceae bacterium DXS]